MPTEIIAEVTWGGALWDQLATLQRLPEARSIQVIGVASPDRQPPPSLGNEAARASSLAERGIRSVAGSVFDLDREFASTAAASEADPFSAMRTTGAGLSSAAQLANP